MFKPGEIPNPTGKGGFEDNPQNRANGRWSKDTSISYWYNYLIRLSVSDFKDWLKTNTDETRTIAQELAYQAVISARKDISYLKEITDRTEGKAVQVIDANMRGEEKKKFQSLFPTQEELENARRQANK